MNLFWTIAWTIGVAMILVFSFVIAFGAPFLPTLKAQVPKALDLIDLQPGQTLLELGSGDGRVLTAAAERGLTAIGYELNPVLVVYSWLRTRKHRKNITIIWGNYWRKQLPDADGIFVFLLQPYMEKLNTKIEQECRKPVKLVSFAFTIESRKPLQKSQGLFLYSYR